MSLRHLFGPVSGEFADQFLFHAHQNEPCLTFGGAGTDLTISPADTWTEIRAKLPADWEPEAVALWLPYTEIPAGLWTAPIPVVGLAADWNLLWHSYRSILPRCDLVLTDLPGVEALQRAGFYHVRPANLFGLDRAFLTEPIPASP